MNLTAKVNELNKRGLQTREVANHVDEEHKRGWIDAGNKIIEEAMTLHSLIVNLEIDIEEIETEMAFA